MKQRISKNKAVEIITAQIGIGSTYSYTLNLIERNWTISDSSFKRYWQIGNETHLEAQNLIKKAIEVQSIANEVDKIKTLNLTKIDRMLIAENIAMGKAKKIGGQLIVPSPSDQLKALDYLSKIESDYAPTKTANTDVAGNDAKIKIIGIEYID